MTLLWILLATPLLFEGGATIVLLFLLFAYMFYPLLTGAVIYLTAYQLFKVFQRKREALGYKKIRLLFSILWHLLFFVVSAAVAFLVGLIAFDLNAIITNIAVGSVTYLVGVVTYSVANFLLIRRARAEDESKLKRRKAISLLFTVLLSLIIFVMGTMIGINYIVLTLM